MSPFSCILYADVLSVSPGPSDQTYDPTTTQMHAATQLGCVLHCLLGLPALFLFLLSCLMLGCFLLSHLCPAV